MRRQIRGYPPAFIIALAANAFFFFSFQGSFPVLPRFIAEVVVQKPPGSVGGQVGLATTVVALVAVLTRIPTGQLADRFGRRRFMLFGAVCFALAPVIYAASRDMPLLLLGRVIHGLGLATFTTAFQALIADLAPAARRGEALGLAGASVSVAFITAPPAGDWMAIQWGYTAFFYVSAATAAASVLLVIFIAPPPQRRPNDGPARASDAVTPEPIGLDGLRLALAQKGVRTTVLTMAALGIPFGAFITFMPLFADERGIGGSGLVFSVYSATILVAQPLAGWLSDRIGRVGVILPGLVVTGAATALLALDGSSLMFVLAGMVFGVGGGLVRAGADALAQDSVLPSLRGTAAAVQYTSFDFWIGLGSLPTGLLATAVGYGPTFLASGAFCLAGAAAMGLMSRSRIKEALRLQQKYKERRS